MQPKFPSESVTTLTDLVLPGETNPLNNLFGGELLARMDRAASITARRHSRRICVTASVNHVAFNRAIPLGSVVTVESKVSRTFNTSMEIFIDVWIEDRESGIKNKANEAIYTLFEGVAGVEEIDTVMKLGMAHPMGPLQLADFIGLDVCLAILEVLHDGFGNPKYAPCPLLVNMVMAGKKGVKSGEGFYSWTHGTKDLVVAANFKK
jgi:acyl-CoA hydrolase